MRSVASILGGVGLVAAGAAGYWWRHPSFAPYAIWFLAWGLAMLAYLMLKTTYYRKGSPWPAQANKPHPLYLDWRDYLKAGICWADAFKWTYAVEPGLYYTGASYDPDAPLLVTSNYHLTIFLVVRRIRTFNARLLIVDTDGINVWCAAGKGRFSNARIHEQLARYDRDVLTKNDRLTLVLPKLCFAGVDIQALSKEKIRPVVGPVYAKHLPAYLSNSKLKNRSNDRVVFGMQSRLFTCLPGLLQAVRYSLVLALCLWALDLVFGIPVPVLPIVGITALLAAAYPIVFPWLPGTRFAVKGIWLAAIIVAGLGVLGALGTISGMAMVTATLFTFATALLFAQLYTGNSAVSNYTRVRQEIARFLPVYVLLYIVCFAAFIAQGAAL